MGGNVTRDLGHIRCSSNVKYYIFRYLHLLRRHMPYSHIFSFCTLLCTRVRYSATPYETGWGKVTRDLGQIRRVLKVCSPVSYVCTS